MKVLPPMPLGEISPDATPVQRRYAEPFLARVRAGEDPGVVVGQLATRFNVRRPAIWRSLRDSGVLPPYNKRSRPIVCGDPPDKPAPPQPGVSRDPCFMCGTRGDLGCSHRRAVA
jgi:hypothetical protein